MNTKECNKCKETYSVDFFHNSTVNKDGKSYICKDCFRKYRRNYIQEQRIRKDGGDFVLWGTTESDYKLMYLFLEKMGYDIFGDIHQQFCEQHGLKPKKKIRKNFSVFASRVLNKLKESQG